MWNPARTPFGAVFRAEVVYNLRRAAPYVMAVIFAGNAALWWGAGPAASRGWATNSDHFIARNFITFSFMTLPFFVALLMGDCVARDFRLRVAPLIFSKPLGRGEYLLGKFCGNFFVLLCCQAAFAATLCALQLLRPEGMLVRPTRALPYLAHFLFFPAASSLLMAAVCFTTGTLTRSARTVYALVASAYVVYVGWQVALKGLPLRWRILLDPLLMNWGDLYRGLSAGELNALHVSYGGPALANRALVAAAACACLALLWSRFSVTEDERAGAARGPLTLGLATRAEVLHGGEVGDAPFTAPARADGVEESARFVGEQETSAPRRRAELPQVTTSTAGPTAYAEQFRAALGVELRLLAAERGLAVLVPVTALLCVAGLASYAVPPDPSYSAAYAARTSDSLLLFLFAAAVFYTGEAAHRDRELRVEPLLWSAPAPNFVLLLPKFAATLLLSLGLLALVGAAAAALQLLRGHGPVEPAVYLTTYAVILAPASVFMIAAALMLHVVLRDKYAAYAVSVAAGVASFYLIGAGHNRPVYNFTLYQLWTPADLLTDGPALRFILTHRAYVLVLSAVCLALAHLLHARLTARGFMGSLRSGGLAWSALAALILGAVAVILALRLS